MPKKEEVTAGGEPRRPFYFLISFAFFIISFLIYLGIYSYNTFFLKKQLDVIDKKNADLHEEISKSAKAEELSTVATAVIKGKSVRSILSAHLYGSKIYELLEKLTIKAVSYNKFSEKISDGDTVSVSVAGEADSFNALAKQLIIFKKSKEIKEIIFKEAALGKNAKVVFSVILNFDSKLITASQ